MKNTITKRKNAPEGVNIRLDETENQVSNLEDKVAENTKSEQPEEKKEFENDYF